VGFLGWKVSPPILLLSKEKCVAPKSTLLKPTAVIANAKKTHNSVDNNKKIVTQLPLINLWKDKENIFAHREKYLSADDVKEAIKMYPVEFVVANVGEKLKWISYDKSFDFWKTELKPHLANIINKIDLDSFPDNYVYVASEWTREMQTPIILLEKYH
jgi:hypothetical protein